jgi:hypothetical protein
MPYGFNPLSRLFDAFSVSVDPKTGNPVVQPGGADPALPPTPTPSIFTPPAAPSPITPPPVESRPQLKDERDVAELAGRAEEGDEAAKKHMTELGDAIDQTTEKNKQSEFDTGSSLPGLTGSDPYERKTGLERDFTAPDISESSGPGDIPGGVGGEAPEEKKSFWKTDLGRRVGSAGVGLAGAGLAQLFGGGKSGSRFMEGFAPTSLEDLKQQQNIELSRRQTAWENTYEDMRNIPPEVYADEQFGELTQAAQALEKDMADGQIDNEKNVSNFLTLKQKFGGEINDFMQGVELSRAAEQAAAEAEVAMATMTTSLKQIEAEIEQAQRMGDETALAMAMTKKDELFKGAAQVPNARDTAAARLAQHQEATARYARGEARAEQRHEAGMAAHARAEERYTQGEERRASDEQRSQAYYALRQAAGLGAAPSDQFPEGRDPNVAMAEAFMRDQNLQRAAIDAVGTFAEEGGVPGVEIGGQFYPYNPGDPATLQALFAAVMGVLHP